MDCYYDILKNPTEEVEKLALENNPRAIEFIENPSEEMMETAIEKDGAI
mgnify:CR=1 FL=1